MAGQLRAVCCVALGGSGRASGHLVTTPGSSGAVRCGSLGRLWPRGWAGTWSQLWSVIWTARRAASGPNRRQRGRTHGRGRTAPGRCTVPPWAVLAERMGGHLVQLRVVRRTARRATGGLGRGPLAGCLAEAGQLRRGALRLPEAALAAWMGGTWSRLWAVSRTASRPPDGRTEGHRLDAWQRPGSSSAARCASLGGPSRVDGQAPGHGSGQSEGRPDGPTVGHQRATGRMHGKGRMPPGRRGTPPWASLAERVGGTWSQLRAVRRTARRADSGPPEGHGPDAGQKPGGSSAARCVALGGSGNN